MNLAVVLYLPVNRHESGWAMMLRPIKLDTARNPRAGQSDQGGLDDVLTIEEVVPVRLIQADVNASADFGQNHHADEIIFNVQGLPAMVRLLSGHAADEGQRI